MKRKINVRKMYPISYAKWKTNYYSNRRFGNSSEKRKWTLDEDAQVLAHEISDTDLAMKLERSVMAIQVRRCKLNKM